MKKLYPVVFGLLYLLGCGSSESTEPSTTGSDDLAVDVQGDIASPPEDIVEPADLVADVPEELDSGPDTKPPPSIDGDNDGVLNEVDNCPAEPNTNQSDIDDDGQGDVCDEDMDGDGVLNSLDCAPTDSAVAPGKIELCDGVDNNCALGVDEEDADGCQIYYPDNDLDGSGPTEEARCLCEPDTIHNVIFGGDCNDNIPTIGPMTPESCNDADDDCDGLIDDGCDDDQDGWCDALMTVVGSPAVCPNGGGDCVDLSALVNPGVQEIPGNFLDDNCDGAKTGDQGPAIADCTGQPCTGQSNEALLCALELCFPGYNVVNSVAIDSPTNTPTDQAWDAVAHYGTPTNSLAPKGAASYVLLSSGLAVSTQHNTILGGGPLPDPYGSGKNQTYDNVEIKIALKAPEGVTGFTVDYIFMSAEYHEFVGKTFNDRFYMVLTAPDTTNGDPEVVNFTECTDAGTYYDFIQDGKKWCYIAVNTAFSEPCPGVTDLSGTGYACPGNGQTDSASTGSSTGWLQTSWPIKAGESFELLFHIHDTADGKYDSTVILDNFRWETEAFNKGTAASFN